LTKIFVSSSFVLPLSRVLSLTDSFPGKPPRLLVRIPLTAGLGTPARVTVGAVLPSHRQPLCSLCSPIAEPLYDAGFALGRQALRAMVFIGLRVPLAPANLPTRPGTAAFDTPDQRAGSFSFYHHWVVVEHLRRQVHPPFNVAPGSRWVDGPEVLAVSRGLLRPLSRAYRGLAGESRPGGIVSLRTKVE
jgi:hypothetical protein